MVRSQVLSTIVSFHFFNLSNLLEAKVNGNIFNSGQQSYWQYRATDADLLMAVVTTFTLTYNGAEMRWLDLCFVKSC